MKPVFPALAISTLLALSACSQNESDGQTSAKVKDDMQAEMEAKPNPTANATKQNNEGTEVTAKLAGTAGNEVSGTVAFKPQGDKVLVVANLKGLKPGTHGFHVHEKGDCSAPDASSAGGHFNPTGSPHGAPEQERKHMGDLGNIEANEQGVAQFEAEFDHLNIEQQGKDSIIGKAVIVHAGRDDLASQPSGDAGARVACGVIEKPAP